MAATISQSVDHNGANVNSDVKTIQDLLNRNTHLLTPLSLIAVSGVALLLWSGDLGIAVSIARYIQQTIGLKVRELLSCSL